MDEPDQASSTATICSYDREWLIEQCYSNSIENGTLNHEELCVNVFIILAKDQEDIQNELVDLIGYSNFEFIEILLSKRFELVNNIMVFGF